MSTTSKLYTFHELMTEGLIVEQNGESVCRKVGRILVPMIQRPYAQGRKSQQSIRDKFLQDIFAALSNNNVEKLELNFLYGTFVDDGESGSFELLDGQQRLTTLFLLHWYLAAMECLSSETTAMPTYLNKFEYQTRTSSTSFLHKLFSAKLNAEEKPSKTIRKSSWYSKSYDKDTTIDSMLRMLDSISEKYAEAEVKPTYGDLLKLKFYVLELNGFGLSEELFIKMNARGLQLTPFENFKADLVGYMKEEYADLVPMTLSVANRTVPYWLNFSSLIDGRWTNLFWEKPEGTNDSGSKECDRRFFRFLQRFFANKSILLAERSKESSLADDPLFDFFSKNTDVERHLGFGKYAEIISKGKEKGIDLLRQLEHLLNFLCDKNVGKIILGSLTAPWETIRDWEPWSTSSAKMGRRQMILLSVLFEYIDKVKTLDEFDEDRFVTWMRFAHIMVQNTDINELMPQITLTRLLNDALNYQPDGNNDFKAWEHPYEAIVGFNDNRRGNRYLDNEATKSRQIIKDESWKDVFRLAESDDFMQGFVTFYYEEGMEADVYRKRTENVKCVFCKGGVTEELAKDYLLIRAILCRNYDWTGMKKNTTIINITNRGADRHLRNLTIWNTQPEVRRLFCQLLDCESSEERSALLLNIAEEEHNLILRTDSYWSDEAKVNLQTLYNRLHSEKEMQVLRWLFDKGLNTMGVWANGNGTGSLYKGTVNCIMLTNERHKVIPTLVEKYKEIFGFSYADKRSVETYEEYGNYSGSGIVLYSGNKTFCANSILKLTFLNYGSLCIDVICRNGKAKELFDAYKNFYNTEKITDQNGHDIANEDGKPRFYLDNSRECYRVNYIDNACSMPIEDLYNVLDMACNVLSKVEEETE